MRNLHVTRSLSYNSKETYSQGPVLEQSLGSPNLAKNIHLLLDALPKQNPYLGQFRKRSFHGPSMCPNCKQEEETTDHLLNSCPLANRLWDKVSVRCQIYGRSKEDSTNTICTWATRTYKIKLLNALWKLIPSFLRWIVWKERNFCIFKDHSSPIEVLWNIICQNLRETLLLQSWIDDDFPSTPQEQNI